MRTKISLILFCIISIQSYSQTDSLSNKLDSLARKADTSTQINIVNPKAYTTENRISFPVYFTLLADDFKQDVTSPFHQSVKNWEHIGIYGASVAAFSIAFDEPIQRTAVTFRNSSKTVAGVSSYITNFGGKYELYSLAALGGYGFVFNNKKMQTTTLLATQAYITGGLLETGLKYITGRQRPMYYNPGNPEPEPTFHGIAFSLGHNVYKKQISTAFPSGHTTVIFAAATVFAQEYKNVRWVPIVAYSAASLVGISRITQNSHWASDVIAGATLGYLCGRQVVNNYHRYSKIKSRSTQKTMAFNLHYNGYNFEPGFLYTF